MALAISSNSSAEGANVSTASQILILQKQVAYLQAQINSLNTRVPEQTETADLYFYTLSNGCVEPGIEVTPIPITATVLCNVKVLVPSNQ
jgi:prefoldin subunit 5